MFRRFAFCFFVFLALIANKVWSQELKLKFNKGTFKIVQFTDLHWISGSQFAKKNDSTSHLMETVIQHEKPDLVVLTGDVVVSGNALAEWTKLVQPMVRNKVPFAINFGNHDVEADATKAEVLLHLQKIPYHLTYNADSKIDGVGNCTLPILSSDGVQNKWMLYFFDSHAYPVDKAMGSYDWIKQSQVNWYRAQSDKFASENGKILPALAFFHIPTPEFSDVKNNPLSIGTKGEEVCSPRINSGLIASFLEKKDVLGVFVGHDHNNDFIGEYQDRICLAYGRKTGYASAYKEILERGARVITFYENEKHFDTHIRTLDSSTLQFTFEQKVDREAYPIAAGTFIQDYLVANWDDARWQEEFRLLKSAGMEYLIFAPAVHTDKEGLSRSIYPSKIKNVQQKGKKDLIDMCLRNAERAGFKVFIGLNFNESWWKSDYSNTDWLKGQMEIGNLVADELAERYMKRYPKSFFGWYWVWEVANIQPLSQPANQLALAKAININLAHRNKKYPNMPFMIAPYMNYRIGNAKDYGRIWENIFAKADFKAGDIFAPQDCVGAGGLEMEHIPEWFAELGKAVKTKPGLRFWSDAETFDQRFWTSAPINRFVKQMQLVSPYVSRIITFAYSHYYSPLNGDKLFHNSYLDYVKTGKLPEIKNLLPPINIRKTKLNDKIVLEWDEAKNNNPISGYYIYKNGKLTANIQYRKFKNLKREFIDDQLSVNDFLYEISAYNAAGDESSRIQFR